MCLVTAISTIFVDEQFTSKEPSIYTYDISKEYGLKEDKVSVSDFADTEGHLSH